MELYLWVWGIMIQDDDAIDNSDKDGDVFTLYSDVEVNDKKISVLHEFYCYL